MSQDPLAAILTQAEADRRRERAAQASAGSVSTPVSLGDTTVGTTAGTGAAGNPVVLDANGKIPSDLMYPPSAGQVARTYQHHQSSAAATWTIVHGLGGYPPPVVLDGAGNAMNGEVRYLDDNTVTVGFGRPETGIAYLSL